MVGGGGGWLRDGPNYGWLLWWVDLCARLCEGREPKSYREDRQKEGTTPFIDPLFVHGRKLARKGAVTGPHGASTKPRAKRPVETRAASRQTENTWFNAHSRGSPAVGELGVSRG